MGSHGSLGTVGRAVRRGVYKELKELPDGRVANGPPPNGDAGLLSIDLSSFWNYDLQPIVVVYAEKSFMTTSNIHYPILSSSYTPSTKNLRRQHFVVCTGGGPVIGQTPEPKERCGQVKAVNVDPHYASGPDPKALGEFYACGKDTKGTGIIGGASGSPVYKHNIAYGIISGNDGGCEGFYQGVNSAQRILRVHITGLG